MGGINSTAYSVLRTRKVHWSETSDISDPEQVNQSHIGSEHTANDNPGSEERFKPSGKRPGRLRPIRLILSRRETLVRTIAAGHTL